ncbi:MAG: hypothetical protein AB1782_07240 [Cyanobacteriota bacterium]
MVSINSSVGNLNTLRSAQTSVKPRTNMNNSLAEKPKEEFSSVLDNSNQKPALKSNDSIIASKYDTSTYSPIMLRYGANKINEIQDIAKAYGVNDLTNQDFDYAIRYGRSLLADYLV